MWSEKLKFNKQLLDGMNELGLNFPREIQEKTMTRIAGGQDIVAIGPEGAGKTTTYVLSILSKLKFAHEEAPRALVLVPDKESAFAVVERFQTLGKNTNIRTLALISGVGMEPQLDALADGVDVVVGTPDRVRAIYLKLALNLNKIQFFVLDDAQLLIKNGFQLPVSEIARSLPKCQHLVFTEVVHEKLEKILSPYLSFPHYVEVTVGNERLLEIYEHKVFHVPNFRTKLNLLTQLLKDLEPEKKVLILVNSKQNADKVYTRLYQRIGKEVQLLKVLTSESALDQITEFKRSPLSRFLVASQEIKLQWDVIGINLIFHFELPEKKETILELLEKRIGAEENNPSFISLATDLELSLIKKIEQAVGVKVDFEPIPDSVVIEKEADKEEEEKKSLAHNQESKPSTGGAFHEKKEKNRKEYNYGYKEKRKMSGKISKRRDR